MKVPWNISALAIAAAIAALEDREQQQQRLTALREGRSYLERELRRIPGVQVMPSEANFVLLDAKGTGLDSDSIVQRMLTRGYFIRSLRTHRASGSLVRITVGSAEQNRACMSFVPSMMTRRSSGR